MFGLAKSSFYLLKEFYLCQFPSITLEVTLLFCLSCYFCWFHLFCSTSFSISNSLILGQLNATVFLWKLIEALKLDNSDIEAFFPLGGVLSNQTLAFNCQWLVPQQIYELYIQPPKRISTLLLCFPRCKRLPNKETISYDRTSQINAPSLISVTKSYKLDRGIPMKKQTTTRTTLEILEKSYGCSKI